MKIAINLYLISIICIGIYFTASNNDTAGKIQKVNIIKNDSHKNEYEKYIVNIANKVYSKWKSYARKKTVIIVDFSKPMEQNRLFIINIDSAKIIISSKVSHGIGSGETSIPNKFSNNKGSKMSSKGVMLTAETYYGYWGYSMRVDGLQNNINSNARIRQIVFHDNTKLSTAWSWGCFSVPKNVYKNLIDLTKEGSLIFVFSVQKDVDEIFLNI